MARAAVLATKIRFLRFLSDPNSCPRYPHLMPKTPEQLKAELEKQNERPTREDHDRTAEGLSVPRPKRDDFFANLEKVSKSTLSDS